MVSCRRAPLPSNPNPTTTRYIGLREWKIVRRVGDVNYFSRVRVSLLGKEMRGESEEKEEKEGKEVHKQGRKWTRFALSCGLSQVKNLFGRTFIIHLTKGFFVQFPSSPYPSSWIESQKHFSPLECITQTTTYIFYFLFLSPTCLLQSFFPSLLTLRSSLSLFIQGIFT
jgi:hypothetical protein